jgi:hypothetical protein
MPPSRLRHSTSDARPQPPNVSNPPQAAAQCYLKALSLNSDADHVWGYLTMVFSSMGRPDLVGKAARHEHATLCAQLDV